MEHDVQFNGIYLLLMTIVCATEGTFRDSFFNVLKRDQSITGQIAEELTAKTDIHCSIICNNDDKCKAYQHNNKGTGNCIIIWNICGNAEEQIFEKNDSSAIYEQGLVPRFGWKGPEAVFYESFDDTDGLVLKEGLNQADTFPLVFGKVNCAWTLNHTKNQSVDLGIHTEACMTRPDSCGAAGGAISLWLNFLECTSPYGGIVSSRTPSTRGSIIFCANGEIWVEVAIQNGYFTTQVNATVGWSHLVLNNIGPNNGQGARMFIDGQEVASGTTQISRSGSVGDGRVVVGRTFINHQLHASVGVDELIFFNQALNLDQIRALHSAV